MTVRKPRLGYDYYLQIAVDGRSRIAYAEAHPQRMHGHGRRLIAGAIARFA